MATNSLLDKIVEKAGELYTAEHVRAIKGMRPDLVTQVWEIIVNCVGPYQKTSVNPPARRARSTRPNAALESVEDTETRLPLTPIENAQ